MPDPDTDSTGNRGIDDAAFPGHVAERLAALPGVRAVTLGGSRATGTHRHDSDWDFAGYYQDTEPQIVDSAAFERAFGTTPTHLAETLDATWPGAASGSRPADGRA